MNETIPFISRIHAGQILAKELLHTSKKLPIVLGLARGGVIVASEVARRLHAPLDVLVVRKIGSPQNPEFGIGAISEDDVVLWERESIQRAGLCDEDLEKMKAKEEDELHRRITLYRKGKPLPEMTGKTVIIVDDGVATGVTARAAIKTVQKHGPSEFIFASPVCSGESFQDIKKEATYTKCCIVPSDMQAIGKYYQDFHQVTDKEVLEALLAVKETRTGNELG